MHKWEIEKNGFTTIEDVFSGIEVDAIIEAIEQADQANANFRKSDGLFAIRQFIKEVPGVVPHVFTPRFRATIEELLGEAYFVVKSIYFDKPDGSNWFVAYHQDLTISVKNKVNVEGYGPWSLKVDQFAVQPPVAILESNFTIRIHLDDTNEQNGALKVVPGSHLKGIYRPETINRDKETEVTCCVRKGGIMIMKPLLLHSSARTTNGQRRRVIHIEFSSATLPSALEWAEKTDALGKSVAAR